MAKGLPDMPYEDLVLTTTWLTKLPYSREKFSLFKLGRRGSKNPAGELCSPAGFPGVRLKVLLALGCLEGFAPPGQLVEGAIETRGVTIEDAILQAAVFV